MFFSLSVLMSGYMAVDAADAKGLSSAFRIFFLIAV